MKTRLTLGVLNTLRQGMKETGAKGLIIWDAPGAKKGDTVRGFGVRLGAKDGSITFFLNYIGHGRKERRLTLGTLGEFKTIERARDHAATIRLRVRSGEDPLQDLREKRKGASQGPGLAGVIEKWQKAHADSWSPKTAAAYANLLKKNVAPVLGDREIGSITKAEWSDLLAGVRARSTSVATLLRRTIGSLLQWAKDEDLLTAVDLPSARRSAPKGESRERVLSDHELAAIWAACAGLEPRQRAFARLVITSALRTGAAALVRRTWIRQDHAGGATITIPGDTEGLKRRAGERSRPHIVALGPWAYSELAEVLALPGEVLFMSGRRAPFNVTGCLDALRSATSIEDHFTLHDVRRSCRTWMAAAGVGYDASETVLGHAIHRSEIDSIYNRHSYEAEAAAALMSWQRHIEMVITGTAGSNVVELRHEGR